MRITDFTTTDVTVEQMGAGGFGLVLMGPNHANSGKWTALKTLRPELLALRPQLRDLFVSEGLIWTGLWPHPNLLTCEGAIEINGHVYLVLAYAAGGSLRDLLPRGQPFATRLTWAQHIAAGLVALHTPDPEFLRPKPLVHRDLKPENVLVDEDGWAQITDFGLAVAVAGALRQDATAAQAAQAFALIETLAAQGAQGASASAQDAARTRLAFQARQATRTRRFQTRDAAGVAAAARGGVGTISYMPPEQWLADGEVGPPADLYAFGLILSELLGGRHGLGDLEEDRDEAGWYQLHTQGAPRPLRGGPAEGAARLPLELEKLYTDLLAKRAADRPDARQALLGLQRAAAALGEEPYSLLEDFFPRTDEHRLAQWHNWASTCFRFGRLEDALERNAQARALEPEYFHALNSRGNILAGLGEQALATGDEALARRRWEEALACHERALAAAPDDRRRAAAQNGLGSMLRALGRYGEAEAAYAAALALDPDNGVAWFNRALNALDWERAEAAARRTEEAARILAVGEKYMRAAQRCGFNHPSLPRLLALIQQARAELKP